MRRVTRTVVLLTLAVLAVGVLLRADAVRTPLVRALAERGNPWPGTLIEIDATRGSTLRGLVLYGVRISEPGLAPLAEVDTLTLRYRLLPLFQRRVVLHDVQVNGLRVRTRADSSGRLAVAEPFVDTDSTASPWTVRLDSLEVNRGLLRVVVQDGSIWSAEGVHARASGIETGGFLRASIDTLGFRMPDPPLGVSGRFGLIGSWAGDVGRVDTLVLQTERSKVHAHGVWDRAAPIMRLVADPLVPGDLGPLLARLPAEVPVHLDLEAKGPPDSVQWTVEGRWLDGSIRGSGRLGTSDPLALSGSLETDRLPLSWLLDATETRPGLSTLSAVFDLAGDRADRLSGAVDLKVPSARFADLRLSGARLEQRWSNGHAETSAHGRLNGASFSMRGGMRPFEPDSSARGSLSVRGADLAHFFPGSTIPIRAALEASYAGPLAPTPGRPARVRVEAAPALVGSCPDVRVVATARLTGTGAGGEASGVACGGSFRGSGTVTGSGAWRVPNLSFEDLPVAMLAARTDTSSISGRLSVRGGSSGATLQGTADLQRVRWNAWRVDSLSGIGSLGKAGWRADARLHRSGSLTEIALSSDGGTIRLDQLTARHVDLGRFAGWSSGGTDLNVRAAGVLDPSGAGRLEAQILPSRFNEAQISSGRLEAEGGASQWRIAAALNDDAGAAEARIVIDLSPLRATVDTLRLDGINPWSYTASSERSAQLNASGHGQLMWDGTLETAEGAVRLELHDGSRLDLVRLSGGSLTADLRGGVVDAAARLRSKAGDLRVDVRAEQGPSGDLALEVGVIARSFDVSGLVFADSSRSVLSGRLDGALRADSTGIRTAEVRAQRIRGQYRNVRIQDVGGTGRFAEGLLQVDSLLVASSALQARISGMVPLSAAAPEGPHSMVADLIVANIADAGLETVSTVAGNGRLVLEGTPDALRLDGSVDLTGLRLGSVRITDARIDAQAEFGADFRLNAAQARASSGVITFPRSAARKSTFTLTAQGKRLRATGLVDFADRRSIAAQIVVPDVDEPRLFDLERLDVLLDEDRWTLLAPAPIRFGEVVSVGSLVLSAGERRIAVGGRLDPNRRGALGISARGVRLDALLDQLQVTGMGGELGGTFSLEGAADDLRISGNVDALLRPPEGPVVSVAGRLLRDAQTVQVDAEVVHASGATATLRGYVPSNAQADAPVGLVLRTESMPGDWLDPFLNPALIDRLSGLFSADVFVDGTFGDPHLGGTLQVRDGRFGLPDLGRPGRPLPMSNVRIDAEFRGDTLFVADARARSGGGTLSAAGPIVLTDLTLGAFDLAIQTDDFLAIDDGVFRAVADASLALRGSTRDPVLSGSLMLESGDFLLADGPDALEPVELTPADLVTLERRFGARFTQADTSSFDFYEALTIRDLSLELARNSWLRSRANPRMDIQFTGDLDVDKKPFADPEAFGSIEVVPARSRIEQFGRRFDIERGNLTFNGPISQPTLDLGAIYQVRSRRSGDNEVTITLLADGRPDNLKVQFTSEPPMELSDIVSYIATGRPASQSLQFSSGSDSYLQSAAGLAVGPISNLVEDLAGAGLGLDVVEIDQDGLQGLTLTAGKYVTPRFYVAVSQPISLGQSQQQTADEGQRTQVTMEYEIVRQLLLSLINRGTLLRVDLRWEHAY